MKKIILITTSFLLLSISATGQMLSLDQCIELALKNKETLKSAALDVKSARLGKRGSLQNVLPSVSANTSWSETKFLTEGIPSSTSRGADLTVNQTLFDGGVMWNAVSKANNSYVFNQQMERQTKTEVVYEVIQAYYSVLKSQQLLDVARMNLMLANQQVELVTNQFEIGAAAKTDLLKVNVLKGQAQIQVIQRDAEVQQSLRNIRNAMGMFDSDNPIILQDVEVFELDLPEKGTAIKLMGEYNPSLLVGQSQIKDAQLSYKITRSAHLPSIGLRWRYNTQPVGFGGQETAFDDYHSVGVGISIPLFTGFDLSTRSQQSKININRQEYAYITLKNNLTVQLEFALELLNNYNEMIPINEEVLTSAEEDLNLVQERYALGSVTILEVLDAQLSVTQARSSLVSTKYDAQIQAAALQALTGVLDSQY